MIITIVTTLMLMAAYFLILYAGVAFIQDKRFFGSACALIAWICTLF